MNAFVNLLEPNRLPCMTKVWEPLIPNRKDKYLTPEELKLTVLHSPRIVALIDEYSQNDKKKWKQVAETVRDMLNEIGLSRSLPVIRWAGIILNNILQRICTGVYVNEQSILRLKRVIGTQPVLYLPSHRSYADFVLMSYICFAYDLEIPGIAAGMGNILAVFLRLYQIRNLDFHAMVGVGMLLRRTGAFFMRRSFANDKLYWHVFKEYMRSLVKSYHTGVEFFIEGTRSRSCKALPPKIGLLSMALEPLFMGEVADITIVPIGVSYERPLEERLFAYELLGVPKPKESTVALFKALNILGINHGSMYVNFGEPISAREYFGSRLRRFEHAQLPIHVQQLSKSELTMFNDIGQHIVAQQQKLIVLSTFNLISIYFNYRSYFGAATDLEQMCQGVLLVASVLTKLGALVAVDEHNTKAQILDSLNIHGNILQAPIQGSIELSKPEILNLQVDDDTKLKGHKLSPNTIRNSVPAFALQCYSNPCLYWLSKPAFTILAAKVLVNTTITPDILQREVENIRNLFLTEFILDDGPNSQQYTSSLDYLFASGILHKSSLRINDDHDEESNLILSSIAPFICCYYHVANTIVTEFKDIAFTEMMLLVKVQECVEVAMNARLSNVHPYCLSLDSISLALNSFYANNYLLKLKQRSLTSNEATYRPTTINSIIAIKTQLQQYCQLLPFNYLNNFLMFAKL